MNRSHTPYSVILAIAIVGMWWDLVNADEPVAQPKGEQVVEFMMSQVSAYNAKIGKDNRDMKLHTAPVLRWTNPVSGIDHGVLVIWHDQNRPVVVAQVFKIPKPLLWLHECQSLATEPILFELEGNEVWAPNRGMLEFKELEGEKSPTDNSALRLAKARSIARRFEASEDFRNTPEDQSTRFVLRLVTQPVYQYESPAHGVTSGYVFAFVNGTDPEVLLVVEAFQNESQNGWRYLLSPMTCWGVSAKLDDQDAWSVPEQYGKTNHHDPYFTWAADSSLLKSDPTE